jgi:hypothetical protein
MKNTRTHVVIGNPHLLIERSATNKSSNYRKAKRIANGTQIEQLAKEQAAKGTELGDEDGYGENSDEEELPSANSSPSAKLEKPSKAKGKAANVAVLKTKKRRRKEDSDGEPVIGGNYLADFHAFSPTTSKTSVAKKRAFEENDSEDEAMALSQEPRSKHTTKRSRNS